MAFSGMNYLAVLVAAIAAFVFGALWYSILGKSWLAALGRTEQPKPDPKVFVMTFVCQLVMAFMMAGLIGHLGELSLRNAVIAGGFVWVGFVLPTMIVNHRFQEQRWSLTLIDGGHWLGVLLIIGAVTGLFGV